MCAETKEIEDLNEVKKIIKCKSPWGIISIEEKNDAVSRIYLPNREPDIPENPSGLLEKAKNQFEEYFNGKRKDFDLPLNFDGCTEFTTRVYRELINVKYGETATYKDIAERVGSPKAYRAVGLANNKNPLAVIVPCHRILGSDSKLVGYAGGLEMKEGLLELERR